MATPLRHVAASLQISALLQYFYFSAVILAFNLEPRLPIIKTGPPGSYFGYSVAEHQTILKSGAVDDNYLLIGAPKASLGPGTVNNTYGGVYSCPLSNRRNDCREVQLESAIRAQTPKELKDGQWLGVTVESQGPGGHVLVCAHRYVVLGPEYRFGRGICFTLTQYLDYDKVYDPCYGKLVTWPGSSPHELYGQCQAGTSAAIAQDDSIVFGTPGPYTWRGVLFVNSATTGHEWFQTPLPSKPNGKGIIDYHAYMGMAVTTGNFFGHISYATGSPRSRDTGEVLLFAKNATDSSDLTLKLELILSGDRNFSSFGYALTSIDLNADDLTDLVVGAPFYDGLGTELEGFEEKNHRGGAIYVYMNTGRRFEDVAVKLTGVRNSRYGFSVASVGDLNRDGYNDLAVGAPFEGDGVIYLYHGSNAGLVYPPTQRITASDIPGLPGLTSFGHSIAGEMDLDDNGYPDILVGAYEVSSAILLRTRPVINVQTVIRNLPESINPAVRKCSDDTNNLCFSFQPCFRFYTSPVEKMDKRIYLRYHIVADKLDGAFYSRVRFRDAEQPHNNSNNFIVSKLLNMYRPTSGRWMCGSERVYVMKDNPDILRPVRFRLTLSIPTIPPAPPRPGRNIESLDDLPVLNNYTARTDFHVDFLKDCGKDDVCESDLKVEGNFDLPFDEVSLFPTLTLGEFKELTMNLDISNRGEPAYASKLYVLFDEILEFLKPVQYRNLPPLCDLHETNITLIVCDLGNPLSANTSGKIAIKFSTDKLKPTTKQVNIRTWLNSTSSELRPRDNVAELSAKVIIRADLRIRPGVSKPETVAYGGKIRGASAMTTEEDIGVNVMHVYDVMNSGPGRVGNASVVISWPYELASDKQHGKYILYLIETPLVQRKDEVLKCEMLPGQVNPLGLKATKVLEELSSPKKEEESKEAATASQINDPNPTEKALLPTGTGTAKKERKRKGRKSKKGKQRVKRGSSSSSNSNSLPLIDADRQQNKMIKIDCQYKTAKCFKFRCPLGLLEKSYSVIIRVRARLWNSTFVREFATADQVAVVSRAQIEIDPAMNVQQKMLEDDESSATTIAQPDIDVIQETPQIELWIIVVAICGGILVFIILVLILWRLGFFKRKKPQERKATLQKNSFYDDDS